MIVRNFASIIKDSLKATLKYQSSKLRSSVIGLPAMFSKGNKDCGAKEDMCNKF